MIRKRVWRYYCEFCGKGSCSGGASSKHEKGCTANPNRTCGHCRKAGLNQQYMTDLIVSLGCGDADGVNALRKLSEGCPSCMLAAIRQSGLQRAPEVLDNENYDYGFRVDFDFKKEKDSFWSCINEEERSHEYGYYGLESLP